MSHKRRRTHARPAHAGSSTHSVGGFAPEPGNRQARLEQLLRTELQSLIRDESGDPSLEGVQVLAVHLSPDGGHARVAYAVTSALDRERATHERAKSGLARATGFFRARLAAQFHLKRTPKLGFTFVGAVEPSAGEHQPGGGEPCPE